MKLRPEILTERDPEGKRDNDELGDQHLCRSQEADLHILQNRSLVKLCLCVNIPTGLLPDLLGFLHEDHIASCLF
jgi:hypothetical protein